MRDPATRRRGDTRFVGSRVVRQLGSGHTVAAEGVLELAAPGNRAESRLDASQGPDHLASHRGTRLFPFPLSSSDALTPVG